MIRNPARIVGKVTVAGFAASGGFVAVGLAAFVVAHYPWGDD